MLYIVEILVAFGVLAVLFALVGGLPLMLWWGWSAHPQGVRWAATFGAIGAVCLVVAVAALTLALRLDKEPETMVAPFFVWFLAAPLAALSAVGFADSWRITHRGGPA